jgi:hypothetical protein
MLRVYYLNAEYEPGKHKIMKVWSDKLTDAKPEDSPKTAINVPYTVIEIDEQYNGLLCRHLLTNHVDLPDGESYDKFYVDSSGCIVTKDGQVVTLNLNPYRKAYKLPDLCGLTQAQLETYIENNITTLASAKAFLKKLSAVVLWLVKQTRLED